MTRNQAFPFTPSVCGLSDRSIRIEQCPEFQRFIELDIAVPITQALCETCHEYHLRPVEVIA